MKRILGVLLTIAMLIGIFPTALFATGTNTQQNETVTYSIFDAIIPFSNMVDCQRTTYTDVGEMQQLSGFDYVYSANEDRQISDLVSDVVENPDDYYYRFSEEVDGGITLTMYKYGDSTFSYELSQNGYMQTYGENCFLYVADGYGTFVSFRDKEYHMCDNHTHAENYSHEEVNSLGSSRKKCILCGCGETFIIKGYEPSIADLKALPIAEGLVEIDHTHGYDETGKCPCGKYDNKTEIDKADAGIYSDVVVDGLADALEDNLLEDSSVSVLLKVSENISATAEKDAITQIANGQEIDFIELSLLKSVNGGALQDIGSQNDNLLKIKIPFDETGKQNIAVYRYHGSTAEKLSTTANADGEYFEVDAGYIIIYAKKFSTYAIGYTVESSSGTHANHCVCGTTHTSIGNHTTEENPTWEPISSADDFTKNKDSGYYYLTDDIEVSTKWEFTKSRDIVLCLNGYDITYTGSSNVSFIPGSTTLNFTLTDCKAEAGSISGFKNTYGGAINVKKTFTMYNGKITGNTASQGGGVYVDQNATFYMYGGKITGNTASSIGGGVYIKGSMEVAGAPVVNNNENSNTSTTYPSSMYKYTKNIYSSTGAITVGTGGLATGAQLDVTPMFPVSESTTPDAVVTIAKGCTRDLSGYFTYTSKHEYTKQYDEAKGEVQLKYVAPPAPKVVVTFDMNGHGEQIPPQTIDKGTCATRPENPTADGYLFLGWEDDYGSWDFGWEIWFNTTLYAKWVEKPAQSAPETPVAVGETIKGKNDGKITGVTDAMEYKKQGDADYIAITGTEIADLAAGTYLVRYKETDSYLASPDNQLVVADGALITVTFASNGGSAVDSQTCEYNQTITAPDAPTKEGFEFIAWYADDTLITKWDFANTITETKTLYAKWVQGTVSDHEDHVDEIEAEGLNDIAKAEETDIKLVVQTEPITEGDTEQTAIKDITDAPDNFNFYDITLEKSTGGYVTDASSVIEIKLPYDFSRKTNIKVYRYHNGMPEELAQLEAKATAPYVDGKCFIDAANNCIYVYSSKFSTYAVAYDTVRSSSGGGATRYTVKFDTDGGSKIANKTVTRNSKIAEPTVPKKEGYKFDGWYKDKEFTTAYDFTAKVTKSFTLYAKWEKVNDEKEENPDTHNCPSKSFDDLDVTLWYHLDVDYVLENGLMKGTDTKTFAPNDKLTRAMLVTVLYRMENEPSTNRSIPFSDVDMGAYYANAVSWAKQNGIVNGVTETEFAPNDNITREQIAAIMYRYAQYKGMDASTLEENLHFADSSEIFEYAVSSMNWVVGTGLINGKSESILAPKDNATRAEVAAILHRFMDFDKSEFYSCQVHRF